MSGLLEIWSAETGEVDRAWIDAEGHAVPLRLDAEGRIFAYGDQHIADRDAATGEVTMRPARPAFTLLVTGPSGEELARIEGDEIKERIDVDAAD